MKKINNIKEIRTKKKLSLYDLSEKTELTPSYISNLENGYRNNPTKDTMDKLAKALGQTVTDLFYKEG